MTETNVIPVNDPLPSGKVLGRRELVLEADKARQHRQSIGSLDNELFPTETGPRPIWPSAGLFYEAMEFPGPREHEQGRAAFNSGIHWNFHGILHAGDRLDLQARVSDRWIKRGREYAIIEVTAHNQRGELVAVGGFKESWDRPPAYHPPLRSLDGVASSWWTEPRGAEVGRFDCHYTDAMSRLFCGSVRNLHTEPELARQRGFDRLVIAGPQIVSQMSELMTRAFDLGYLTAGEIKVNLLKPVFSGDTISARVAYIDPNDEGGKHGKNAQVQVAIWAVNQHAETVAGGMACAGINLGKPPRTTEQSV